MTCNYKNFQRIAIVQYPEQVDIYKNYFSSKNISQNTLLWVATSDAALLLLEKEEIFVAKITDFYDYNIFYKNIFNNSYENLGKALRCIDNEIFKEHPTLKKYNISFTEGSFYYLRMWCDSVETDIYEMQALKNTISEFAIIHYVSSIKTDFCYGLYPLHVHRSLDEAINLVFEKEKLCVIKSFDPKTSIVNFSKDFESETMNAFFKKRIGYLNFIEKLKKKTIYLFLQLWKNKKYLGIGIDREWLADPSSFVFFENYIHEIQQLPCSITVNHDQLIKNINSFFVINNLNYYVCLKDIIYKTLEEFLMSVFKTIDFYHKNKYTNKWVAILSSGFYKFEFQTLAKIFKFYGKKVICTHHGSLGILQDKINHYIEYPFVTDYIVWGKAVKTQLQQEYNFNNIRIHTFGSLALSFLRKQIEKTKKKNLIKSPFTKPIIIFLLQTNNYKVRVTFDHPPDILDFIKQREMLASILDTCLDFYLIIKGHPSTDFYFCSPLRDLFKKDKRIHYTTLPLTSFLADSTCFITDRPSTSLFQAMIAGLKCYCLINSEFYLKDFVDCLSKDGILFKNTQELVKNLHNYLANGKFVRQHVKSITISNYCDFYKGSIKEILKT